MTKQLELVPAPKKAGKTKPAAPAVTQAPSAGIPKDLATILKWPRSHNTQPEKDFRLWVYERVKEYAPTATHTTLDDGTILAEVIATTTPTTVAFCCHMDTVDHPSMRGEKDIFYDEDFERITLQKGSIGNCLGADDGVGVWMLLEMLKAGKPGLYIFHTGEECGKSTAKELAKRANDFLKGIDICVEFDRPGMSDIVTHQRGGRRCASDKFAQALAAKLNAAAVLNLSPSSRGVYTDCYEYRGVIAECVNLSVGYHHQHTIAEDLDLGHARELLHAVLTIDWDTLPVDRDPAEPEVEEALGYYARDPSAWQYGYNQGFKSTPQHKKVVESPADYRSALKTTWRIVDVEEDPEGAAATIQELALALARAEGELEVWRSWGAGDVPVNREQRRALKKTLHQAPRRRWEAKRHIIDSTIFLSRPYDTESPAQITRPDLLLELMNMQRLALQKLRDGAVDVNDAMPAAHVGELIATNTERAKDIGGGEVWLPTLAKARQALEAIYRRRNRFSKWEVQDDEWEVLCEAFDIAEAITAASSPMQMRNACLRADDFWNRAKDLK